MSIRAPSELNAKLLAALRARAQRSVIAELLHAGADAECALPASEGGYRALHIAARLPDESSFEDGDLDYRQAEVVEVLLDHGANPNATANGGQTPLLVALGSLTWIWDRDTTTIRTLLAAGAKPSQANCLGHTPLMTAIGEPYTDLLLKAGAEPGATDRDGWSALEWASALHGSAPLPHCLMEAVSRKIPGRSEAALAAFVQRELPVLFDPAAFSQAAEIEPLARPADAARAADYLAAGYPLLEYGRVDDNVLTDGQWAWPEVISDRVRRGSAMLPARLVEKLDACAYRMPFLDPMKLWAKTYLFISEATYLMKPRYSYLHRYFCTVG